MSLSQRHPLPQAVSRVPEHSHSQWRTQSALGVSPPLFRKAGLLTCHCYTMYITCCTIHSSLPPIKGCGVVPLFSGVLCSASLYNSPLTHFPLIYIQLSFKVNLLLKTFLIISLSIHFFHSKNLLSMPLMCSLITILNFHALPTQIDYQFLEFYTLHLS